MKEENNNNEKNSPWNHIIEEVVKDIGESCKAHKMMHLNEAQHASTCYSRLMMAGIILGPLSGMMSALGAALNMSDNPSVIVSEVALGFLSGVVVAIIKFNKYDEVSTINKTTAAKYSSLESNVRRQLGLYRSDRIPALNYMDWIESKYDELFNNSPLLSNEVFENYTRLAEKKGWKIPHQYTDDIEINEEYESKIIEDQYNENNLENVDEDSSQTTSTDIELAISKKNHLACHRGRHLQYSRTKKNAKIPHIDSYSDNMLKYELCRMSRNNK